MFFSHHDHTLKGVAFPKHRTEVIGPTDKKHEDFGGKAGFLAALIRRVSLLPGVQGSWIHFPYPSLCESERVKADLDRVF